MSRLAIAFLGKRDEPTDAVEEYCRYLADALRAHEVQLEIRRVPWEIHGWSKALKALQLQATRGAIPGCWCNTPLSLGPHGDSRKRCSAP